MKVSPNGKNSLWFNRITVALFIAVLSYWLYYPSLHFPFWSEDYLLLQRSHVETLKDFAKCFLPTTAYLEGRHDVHYRPLSTFAYFGTMKTLTGTNPFYFRIASLTLFALISLMVYAIASSLSKNRAVGLFSSLLFTVNTNHSLIQFYLTCGQELFVAFFLCLAFYAYMMATKDEGKVEVRFFVASVSLFVMALLSKEMAITFPALIVTYELLYRGKNARNILKSIGNRVSVFVIITIAYLTFRMIYFTLPEGKHYRLSFGVDALVNVTRYFMWSINPSMAGLFHLTPMDSLVSGRYVLEADSGLAVILEAFVVCACILIVAYKSQHMTRRNILFGLGWFLITLLPVAFITNHFNHYFLLVPSIGLMIAAGNVIHQIMEFLNRRAAIAGYSIVAVLLIIVTFRSAHLIRDEESVLSPVAIKCLNIESQLLQAVPDPPDHSLFVFTSSRLDDIGFMSAWFGRDAADTIRVFYNNETLNSIYLVGKDFGGVDRIAPGKPVYYFGIYDNQIFPITTG